jgi:glutathione peroxidase
MSQFYNFNMSSLQGQPLDFNDYKDKVVLVVNTASKCGLTPQYEGLQALHNKYADKGLVIIGCPCNQFGKQEPGTPEQIQGECLINYGVDFTITEKIDVNGDTSHPLYKFLRSELNGVLGDKIKWNFTKFLIGRDGNPIKRFAPTTTPAKLESYIEKALG